MRPGPARRLAPRHITQIEACTAIETFALEPTFTGQLPDGWAAQLCARDAQTDPDEKDPALAPFNAALANIPADSAVASQLQHVLSLSSRP